MRRIRAADDIGGSQDGFAGALSHGSVVLLCGARPRHSQLRVKRVLLLATTTGYQIRSFGEAARAVGASLMFASDRCDQLDDPWADHAIPVRFSDDARTADGLLAALSIQRIESVKKGLGVGFSSGDVFRAGDMKKFLLESRLLKDHFYFMAEGAGRDGQGIGGSGFAHKLANSGENDQMFLHRL